MKKLETHKYPCWVTRDQDGTLTVWRGKGKMHTDDLPPKPMRLRPGTTPVIRMGWVGIEEPKVEEGEGKWTLKDYSETQAFRFCPQTAKDYFPEIKWENEPVKAKVCYSIEIDRVRDMFNR